MKNSAPGDWASAEKGSASESLPCVLSECLFPKARLPIAVMTADDLEIVGCNPAAAAAWGAADPSALCGARFVALSPERQHDGVPSAQKVDDTLAQLSREGAISFEWRFARRDGGQWDAEIQMMLLQQGEGAPLIHMRLLDITERKQTEAAREKLRAGLVHSEKMEAIGRLAGGVAHDFNNMLGVILGQVELVLADRKGDVTLEKALGNIEVAATRSIDLTQQLLAFARKQSAAPQVLDFNDAVTGMVDHCRHLIDADVALTWRPGEDVGKVRIDPLQLEHLLANLCVNAMDATRGRRGEILIETDTMMVEDGGRDGVSDAAPGEYVVLSVTDNGVGMSKEVRDRIFEPFFSTKGLDKRGGLGLATVYGIVQQNDGFIRVESEPGIGSRFLIHLRKLDTGVVGLEDSAAVSTSKREVKNILLVEDEPVLLELYESMLSQLGLNVWSAASPSTALEIAASDTLEIDLVITDVVMPGMNGRDLFARLLTTRPSLRCLYISGYNADVIAHRGVLEPGLQFLQKPFTLTALSEKLQEMAFVDN